MTEPAGPASTHLIEAERLVSLDRLDEAEVELARIPATDRSYRESCLMLIDIARRRHEVSFRADHLLRAFLSTPPANERERVALRVLATLYDEQGHDDLAAEVRALIEAVAPKRGPVLPDLPPLPAPRAKANVSPPSLGALPTNPTPSQAATLPTAKDAGDTLRSREGASTTGVWASLVKSIDGSEKEAPLPTPPSTPAATPAQRSPTSTKSASSEGLRSAYQIGAVVNDRYEILDQLGRGGMATVYRVFDRELEEAVALKLFLQKMTDDEEGTDVARFKRELKLARRLRHTNIVQLFDLGTYADHYYITLELLDGEDLHRVLRRQRTPWAVKDVVMLARQICAGLDAAHALGVIHRDIKPANIFIPSSGPLKIMDFGIAKSGQDGGDLATKTA
jgi:tRNA A-37 threonylcarbamoyl transferase component Bud32